jgi:hypothetical protein
MDAAQGKLEDVQKQIQIKRQSLDALSGSLLQYAKQGISIVHGGLKACPSGRKICTSEDLKEVIWQSRNQAIHWEEGKPHPPVVRCFENLEKELCAKFGDFRTKSQAFHVLYHLDWVNYQNYEKDVSTLMP